MKKNINYFSEILKKPWAIQMLSLYDHDKAGKQIFRWSDFKKRVSMNDKLLGERLKTLCEIGILRNKRGGYAYSRQLSLCYIFNCKDMRLIQDCPIDSIYSTALPYEKVDGDVINVRYISYYGLEKRNQKIDDIFETAVKKTLGLIDNIHKEKLWSIVDNECKKIENKQLVKFIKEWYSKLTEKVLLPPHRNRDEVEPMRIQFDVPEEEKKEFKEITERLWSQFYKECPPIGIMIRF